LHLQVVRHPVDDRVGSREELEVLASWLLNPVVLLPRTAIWLKGLCDLTPAQNEGTLLDSPGASPLIPVITGRGLDKGAVGEQLKNPIAAIGELDP
jgi:hypothetical protein